MPPSKAMNFDNTLLYGIQKIPGDTAGEKYKFVNVVAKELAANDKHNSEHFPKALKPLLDVEVAKIANNTSAIVEALQTSHPLLCQRALQVPDLFPKEDQSLLTWDNFNDKLLSKVSYITRHKLIDKVSQDLKKKNPKYAENFYLEISQSYSQKEALPLLAACSEDFLNEQVLKNRVVLPENLVIKLFAKYPSLVISYLAKAKPKEDQRTRLVPEIDLRNYERFLPNLLEDHFEVLFELCEAVSKTKETLNLSFGKRRTRVFLKKGAQILIDKPKIFLPMLCLDVVSDRLSEEEFAAMLSKFFPEKLYKFNYEDISKHLEKLRDRQKASVTLAAFQKKYGSSLFDHPKLITPKFLCILPKGDRIRIARVRLENDSDWKLDKLEESWRVYLPFEDIFESVKSQITKRSDAKDRQALICLLIDNCKVNGDPECLLELLKYFISRHKNEKGVMLDNFLSHLKTQFDLEKLNQKQWDGIMEIAKVLGVSNGYRYQWSTLEFMQDGIRFKFKNKMDPDGYIRDYMRLKYATTYGSYNIFLYTNLEFERICLEKFLKLVPLSYSEDGLDDEYRTVDSIMYAVERYNDIVSETRKKHRKKTSIIRLEDYPDFITFYEETVVAKKDTTGADNDFVNMKSFTGKYNSDLHKKWFPDDKVDLTYIYPGDIAILRKTYQKILDQWEEYRKVCEQNITRPNTKRFLKYMRWYKDLPVKFVNASVIQLNEAKSFEAVQVLAILLDGDKYQELIDPLIPSNPEFDVNDEKSANLREQIDKCVNGMKLTNPPVSLNILEKLFNTDLLSVCESALFHSACRTPLQLVISFISGFLNERVALSKKMVELLCAIAPKEDKLRTLESMADYKSHPSIHGVILLKIWQLFNKEPSERVWMLLQKCLQKQAIEDKKVLTDLTCVKKIPNEYVSLYIIKMLAIYESVEIEGCPDLPKHLVGNILSQLDKSFGDILADELQRELVQKYVFDSALTKNSVSIKTDFLMEVFLCGEKNEKKILFFSERLRKFATEHFGKPVQDDNGDDTYPANELVRDIVIAFVKSTKGKRVDMAIANSLQDLFNSLVKPWQDVQSYLYLAWIKEFTWALNPNEFAVIFGGKIHVWINLFGPEYFVKIIEFCEKFITLMYINENDDDDDDDYVLSFVDGLLQVKNNNSYICAALLMSHLKRKSEKHDAVNDKLKRIDILAVHALMYETLYGLK